MPAPEHQFSPIFLKRIKWFIIILAIIAIFGIAIRLYGYISLRFKTHEQTIPTVAVMKATLNDANAEVVLPGNVTAWHASTIFARTNGYLINWMVDIGTRVKTGDLLATISAPEVDSSLRQAEGDLKTAIANNKIAQETAIRWTNLLKTHSVSKQETDEKVSDAKAKAALEVAARANRDRLKDLTNFQRIIAPFDGIIMSRTTDIGHLVNAGSASGTQALFRLVQADKLRVYVRVPQYYAPSVKQGLTADLAFREHPGKTYKATFLNNAKAIDAKTRTLLVQLELDNPNYELLPGSFAQVHFIFPIKNSIILPVNTLIFRSHGMQVAVVDGGNKVILKSIIIGRDFGNTVEVVHGIQANEAIVINPPDSILNGEEVRVVSQANNQETA